jgi:hypothetical protein
MRVVICLSALVLVICVGTTTAQETMDNPEFTTWSKFPKGTSITLKTSTTAMGMASESTITTTLVEVGTDKLVVEFSIASKSGGKEFKAPPMKRDVTKNITLPKGKEKPKDGGLKPPGTYEEGTETLKVSGMEIKTKWYKFKADEGGFKSDGKIWMSEDVPGFIVKMEAKATGVVDSDTKMELVEIKKP